MTVLKIKILIGFIIISFNSFCQEDKFALGIFGTTDYSYRYLSPYSNNGRDITDNRNFYEVPKLAFSAGLDFTYSINTKQQFYVGVLYSQKGQKANNTNTFAMGGIVYYNVVSPDTENSVIRQLHYLEIPIRYNLFFTDTEKKVSPFVTIGISANVLLKEFVVYKSQYNTLNAKSTFVVGASDYNRFHTQAQFGFGLKIKNRLSILTLFKASIFTSNRSDFYNEYLASASVGVNYTLKNF